MEANKGIHRQGDVLFIPMTAEKLRAALNGPDENRRAPIKSGIIQAGEVTGHHHRIADLDAAEVFAVQDWNGERKYLNVTAEGGVSIVHEEHHTVQLPAGQYRVHIAREFDYLSRHTRQVRD
jgi:hypothetical protein